MDNDRDCLIIVDVQNDFCPGGALGVSDGDEVIPVLNKWIAKFLDAGFPVVYTQDWHPSDHCSFLQEGGVWPPHCVRGSSGAEFHEDLSVQGSLFRKGADRDKEAYSGFDGKYEGEIKGKDLHAPCIYKSKETLEVYLKKQKVGRLFVGGLATDYCVKETVLDGLKNGFSVFVVKDGTKAVNVKPKDGDLAIEEMVSLGAHLA